MKKILSVTLLAAALAFVSGCAATPTHYVDSNDISKAALNSNHMSSADWVIISQEAGNALLSSPLFAEYLADYAADANRKIAEANAMGEQLSSRELRNASKPLLMLSYIENNTGEHIDSRLMTERIREVLFNSGRVRFTTYAAGEGQSIDTATAGARQLAADPNIRQSTAARAGQVNAFDLQLSGTIIKQRTNTGKVNEISYLFSLALTDTATGEGVWGYTKEIKRQNERGTFGW